MKIFRLASASLVCAVTLSCGDSPKSSQLNDITDPFDQTIGTAREFWFYEAQEDGLGQSSFPQTDGVNYFPEAMPLGLDDFFWTGSPAVLDTSKIVFTSSSEPGVMRSVPRLKNIKFDDGGISLHLFSESLDNQLSAGRWFADLQPTFISHNPSSQVGGKLQGATRFDVVCYRIAADNLELIPVNGSPTLSLSKETEMSVNLGKSTLIPKLTISNENTGSFVSACKSSGGEVASVLRIEIQGNPSNGIDLEFVGVKTNLVVYDVTNN